VELVISTLGLSRIVTTNISQTLIALKPPHMLAAEQVLTEFEGDKQPISDDNYFVFHLHVNHSKKEFNTAMILKGTK